MKNFHRIHVDTLLDLLTGLHLLRSLLLLLLLLLHHLLIMQLKGRQRGRFQDPLLSKDFLILYIYIYIYVGFFLFFLKTLY